MACTNVCVHCLRVAVECGLDRLLTEEVAVALAAEVDPISANHADIDKKINGDGAATARFFKKRTIMLPWFSVAGNQGNKLVHNFL